MVGQAWNALRQAWFGPHADRLLVVTYDTLTRDPAKALGEIYRFIGQPAFKHDFKTVEFDATEFDRRLGTAGLHDVGREVRPAAEGADLLTPDLRQKYANHNFWPDASANPNRVRVV